MSADIALLRSLEAKLPAERAKILVVLIALACLDEHVGDFHRLIATINPARMVAFADAVHRFIEEQARRYDGWVDAAFFAYREFRVAMAEADIAEDWRRDARLARPAERVPEHA